jgi:phosphate transport system permease protein
MTWNTRKRYFYNTLFRLTIWVLCVLATIPLFLIFAFIFQKGIAALSLDLFTQIPPSPGEDGGGLANAIVGTVMLVGLACVISIPFGVMIGTWLAEFRTSRLAFFISICVEVLHGLPSIVLGILVYAWIVQPLGGFSAWAGGIALGVMMLPVIIRGTEETLKMLPSSLKEASLALGAPYYATILRVILPAGLSGIITGTLVSMSRVAGETAPLLFTAFGNPFMNYNPSQPIASLPHSIYTYAISPYESWIQLAWGGAFVLLTGVLAVNITARILSAKWKWY